MEKLKRKFLLLVAMEKEYELVKEALEDTYLKDGVESEGDFGKSMVSDKVILMMTGVGQVPAAVAITTILCEAEIEKVINVGFAAAYSHQYNLLDVAIPNLVISGSFDLPLPFNKRGMKAGRVINASSFNSEENLMLVSNEEFVTSKNLKKIEDNVGNIYSRLIFDMEGFAVASSCDFAGVPFSFYKVISDHPDKEENINLFLKSIEEENPFKDLAAFIKAQDNL